MDVSWEIVKDGVFLPTEEDLPNRWESIQTYKRLKAFWRASRLRNHESGLPFHLLAFVIFFSALGFCLRLFDFP